MRVCEYVPKNVVISKRQDLLKNKLKPDQPIFHYTLNEN